MIREKTTEKTKILPNVFLSVDRPPFLQVSMSADFKELREGKNNQYEAQPGALNNY